MLRVPVRLQALPYTRGRQTRMRNIYVDGSSGVHAVGGRWCRQQHICFVYARPPAGDKTGGTAFH